MLGKAILYGSITLFVLFIAFTVVPVGFVGGFILAGLIGGFVAGYYACNPMKGLLAGFSSSVIASVVYFSIVALTVSLVGTPIIGVAVGAFTAGLAFISSVIAASLTGFLGGFVGMGKCKRRKMMGVRPF